MIGVGARSTAAVRASFASGAAAGGVAGEYLAAPCTVGGGGCSGVAVPGHGGLRVASVRPMDEELLAEVRAIRGLLQVIAVVVCAWSGLAMLWWLGLSQVMN